MYRSGRQAEALAAYGAARTALDEGLGIDPGPDLQALEVRILQQDPTLAAPPAPAATAAEATPSNLPTPPTPIIGRQAELADLRARMQDGTRLLTLTGPGGTGKTRLALEFAHALIGEDAGGAWFVDLAPSTEVRQAIWAIQAALGVTDAPADDPLDPLLAFVRQRPLLLLLDNLEQVPDIAGAIAILLAAAPGLRVIATSRTPLRIGGEQEVPLAPLAIGAAGETIDVEAPPDAVALFVARARASVPGFSLTPATADAVSALCRRLDGLPLAIELAASRVRLLSPTAILERLTAGLDILRAERRDLPVRQQTLEATIDWSYRLLDEPAQRAFRRCATFAGGFTLPAFESVCADPGDDPLDVLGQLVEHSLVARRQVGEAAEPRFAMLETIRQFAQRRLDDSPESDALRERHMRYFLGLAEAATSALYGPDELEWLSALRDDHDNMRASLDWLTSVDRRDELVEFVSVLSGFWLRDTHYLEGRRWITRALASEGAGTSRARATALRNLAAISSTLGDSRAALQFATESVRLWETIGDVHGLANALRVQSMVFNDLGDLDGARRAADLALDRALSLGGDRTASDDRTIRGARHELAYLAVRASDFDTALRLLQENVEAHRVAGDRLSLAATLTNLGWIQQKLGAPGPAEESARQAIAILRTMGDDASLASGLTTLGGILVEAGQLHEARVVLVDGLALAWSAGALGNVPAMLEALGDLWSRIGDAFRAVELYAAASGLREDGLLSPSADDHSAAFTEARRELGSTSYEQAWQSGLATPLAALVDTEMRRQLPAAQQAGD